MNDAKVFIDTNILVYLYSKDEPEKQEIAREILNRHYSIVSTQVLNEACNVWFNKCGWTSEKIKQHLDNIEIACDDIMTVQRHTIDQAIELKNRYGYSYFDCLMISSALESDCEILFSEDMTSDQVIENRLKIVNPFK